MSGLGSTLQELEKEKQHYWAYTLAPPLVRFTGNPAALSPE